MGRAGRPIKGRSRGQGMRLRDLGELEGPILLFGGPYSNLPALDALIAQGIARGIPPARMICTGDVVAYGASPRDCVARMRALGAPVVAGNCERQLAAGEPNCGCGFAAGSACDLLSGGWYAHADAHVGAEDRQWMASLPDWAVFTHAGRRYGVVHGAPGDIARFLWPDTGAAVLQAEFASFEAEAGPVDAMVSGHSGIPFVRHVGARQWINAGAIGMPPNDGGRQTRFAILDAGRVTIERLDYDWQTARAAMERAGLVQGYDTALASGYWPSEDVLPEGLRAAGGSRASG